MGRSVYEAGRPGRKHTIMSPEDREKGKPTVWDEIEIKGNVKNLSPTLFDYTHLRVLYMNDNQLQRIPSEIAKLQKLQVLDLSNNRLRGLPAELGDMPELRVLNMESNQLRQLPYELGKLFQLEELGLANNPLTPDLQQVYDTGVPAFLQYMLDRLRYYERHSDEYQKVREEQAMAESERWVDVEYEDTFNGLPQELSDNCDDNMQVEMCSEDANYWSGQHYQHSYDAALDSYSSEEPLWQQCNVSLAYDVTSVSSMPPYGDPAQADMGNQLRYPSCPPSWYHSQPGAPYDSDPSQLLTSRHRNYPSQFSQCHHAYPQQTYLDRPQPLQTFPQNQQQVSLPFSLQATQSTNASISHMPAPLSAASEHDIPPSNAFAFQQRFVSQNAQDPSRDQRQRLFQHGTMMQTSQTTPDNQSFLRQEIPLRRKRLTWMVPNATEKENEQPSRTY